MCWGGGLICHKIQLYVYVFKSTSAAAALVNPLTKGFPNPFHDNNDCVITYVLVTNTCI